MKLLVDRRWKKDTYTISRLYIDGELFCNVLEDRDRLLKQTDSLEYIYSIKVPTETAIPSGTYKITMDVVSPKYYANSWYRTVCGGKVPRLLDVPGFSGILIHCLTPDTEILTENGWQDYQSFLENPAEKCYSYNVNTGKAELAKINFLVENDYDGTLYCNEGGRINYSVTDKHQMYAGFKKRDGSYIWEFRGAKDIPHNGVKFITAATKDGEPLTDKQKAFYKLLMAVVADGYILNWSAESSQVRFHLKKERKIERLKGFLAELNSSYRCHIDGEEKTHIYLDANLSDAITEILNPERSLSCNKKLPYELLRLGSEDLKMLVDEYLFWDGRWENYLKNPKNKVISSTNTNTIDVLQAMAMLCGYRSYARKDSRSRSCYDLVLYDNQDIVTPEPNTYVEKNYSGKVWCINNDNHTLFIRKNNRTMVVSNCGNTALDSAGCLLVGMNTEKGRVTASRDTFIKLYRKMKAAADRGEEITIEIE